MNIINKLFNNKQSTQLPIKPTQNHFIFSKEQINYDIENYKKINKTYPEFNTLSSLHKITSINEYLCKLNNVSNLYFNKNYKFKLEKDDIYLKNINDLKQFITTCVNKSFSGENGNKQFIKFKISNIINSSINNGLFTINVILKYDPFISLLRELHFENIEAKITVMEKENDFIFIPNNFIPTHCMVFIRDLIDLNINNNNTINLINSIPDQSFLSRSSFFSDNTYNYYLFTTKFINVDDLFNSNNKILYTNNVSCVFLNDLDIYDATTGLTFINEISFNDLIELSIKCLNNNNYQIYTKFKVLNENFVAGDGEGSDLCNQFIKYAKTKYSFMKVFGSAFACEGGFTFNHHHINDPIYSFARCLPMHTSSKTDLRGNNEFHRHYSTNLWYLFLLYFWLNEYGINTTELI